MFLGVCRDERIRRPNRSHKDPRALLHTLLGDKCSPSRIDGAASFPLSSCPVRGAITNVEGDVDSPSVRSAVGIVEKKGAICYSQ